ncbi:hypothetical protein ACOMHN_019039 [Nucella lapillus]
METTLIVALLLCACITVSSACSCFPHSGPDRYCRFDLIFRGQAIKEYKEQEELIDFSDPYWKYDPYTDWVYTMQVNSIFKMPENYKGVKTISVRTPVQGSLCGTRFRLNVVTVFFCQYPHTGAHVNEEGEITTSLCAPNTPWKGLSEWD